MIQLHVMKLLKNGCKLFKYNKILRGYSITQKTKPPWNVMFFGTDEFSVNSLKLLNNELKKGVYINNLEVVTSLKAKNNSVFKYATKEKLHVHNWPLTITTKYDIGIVVSFGHLIPENIINNFHYGILNVHASLLPRWRGAAPIIHAILNEDTQTGVTIMRIRPEKFDIGDIITQKSIDMPKNITLPFLYTTLAELGAKILIDTLYLLPECLEKSKPQPNVGVTYAPKVTQQMGIINFQTTSAKKVCAIARALHGLYPLQTNWKNNSLKLYDISLNPVNSVENSLILRYKDVNPGFIIYDKLNEQLLVCCSDNEFISVKRIGIVGKKPMTAKDFNNGYIKKEIVENRLFK